MEQTVIRTKGAAIRPERTSTIFSRLRDQIQDEHVTVGTIIHALHDRSFGVIIVLFALPNAVIPISWILGAPILLLAFQMAWGRQEPWLPGFMIRAKMNRETFVKVTDFAERYLSKIERFLKPRWNWLTTDKMERLVGLYLAVLSVVLMAPIPFGNALPAFGMAIIAAGLLEKDGLAIVVGSVIGALGGLYIAAAVTGALAAIRALFGI